MAADKTKLIFNPLSGNFDAVQNVASLVEGPASSVDNTVPRYDSTTGKLLQGSSVVISDANAMSGVTQLDVDNINLNGNTISTTDVDGNLILAPNGVGVIQPSNNIAPATDNTLKLGTISKRFAELNVAYGAFPYLDITDLTGAEYWGSVGLGSMDNTISTSIESYENIGTGRANGAGIVSVKPLVIKTHTTGPNTSNINVSTGNTAGGNSGDINLTTGTASGVRGDLNLTAKDINIAANLDFTGTTATFNGTILQGVDDPVNPTEAANKQYVDGEVSGLLADIPAASMTFTNKTFDADAAGNSITNIENADIKALAAIALNKLAATTINRALISDGSGFVSPSATTATEIGYVSGVTSAIQTQINTKIGYTISTQAADFTAVAGNTYLVDSSAAARIVTLPAPAANTYVIVKDIGNAATNSITIDTPGAETIDGSATYVITSDYGSVTLISNGTNWFLV